MGSIRLPELFAVIMMRVLRWPCLRVYLASQTVRTQNHWVCAKTARHKHTDRHHQELPVVRSIQRRKGSDSYELPAKTLCFSMPRGYEEILRMVCLYNTRSGDIRDSRSKLGDSCACYRQESHHTYDTPTGSQGTFEHTSRVGQFLLKKVITEA